MTLQERIDLLARLGQYMQSQEEGWLDAKDRASRDNGWFIPEFVDLATQNIANDFLQTTILKNWADGYELGKKIIIPRTVGIIMAGNIPLVGFHDWLCVFIAGHRSMIKASSKDAVLIKHLLGKLSEWNEECKELNQFGEMLKGCDAYIATGSNNAAGYFDYYFGKYPHIIRRNRTSIAVLTGNESEEELSALADDVFQYFGLGCRNVTKIYVPKDYDFIPLITSSRKYNYLADNHKYKNNYDYNLAIHLINKKYYMSSEALLLVEENALFSPISQLNYEFYENLELLRSKIDGLKEVQCVVGKQFNAFSTAQRPAINDYADGVDTLAFLLQI